MRLLLSLLCFVTINYKVQFDAVGMNVPNDIAYESLSTSTNEQVEETINSSEHKIRYHLKPEALVVSPVTDRGIAFDNPEYYIPGLWLVAEKDYNELIAARGDKEQVNLQGMEAVSLAQGSDYPKTFAAGETPSFTVKTDEEKTFMLKAKKTMPTLAGLPIRSWRWIRRRWCSSFRTRHTSN